MQSALWHAEIAWAHGCKDLAWVLTQGWALARDTTVICMCVTPALSSRQLNNKKTGIVIISYDKSH